MKRALAVLLAMAAGCGPARDAELSAKTAPPKAETPKPKAPPAPAPASTEDFWTIEPLSPIEPVNAWRPEWPISVQASNGYYINLLSLKVSTVIAEPLAYTEIHIKFQSVSSEVLEGIFRMTVPEGALVSRWAMRLGDGWQEGEVVPSKPARAAYDSFVRRNIDPALLDKQGETRLVGRVFPVQEGQLRELILSYSQELVRPEEPYRLLLRGLHRRLDSLEVRVLRIPEGGGEAAPVLEMQKRDFHPDRNIAIPLSGKSRAARGLRSGSAVVARVFAPDVSLKEEPIGGLLVLLDTSASRGPDFMSVSRGPDFQEQVQKVGAIIEAIREGAPPSAPLEVACFDQEVVSMYRGDMQGFSADALDRIRARYALGASDIEGALRFAQAARPSAGAGYSRVVLITDGFVSMGSLDSGALRAEAARLAASGVERLDVIAPGGPRNEELLWALASEGLAKEGVVIDGTLPGEAIAARLRRGVLGVLPVSVPDSRSVYPAVLRGLDPGEPAMIYADLPVAVPFKVALGRGSPTAAAVPVTQVSQPLVERALAGAKIRSLMKSRAAATADPAAMVSVTERIVDVSRKERVLSDFTSMLVLETEQDYARFKIERRAITDILEVGPRGLELIPHRAPPSIAVAPQPDDAGSGRVPPRPSNDSWAAPPSVPSPPSPSPLPLPPPPPSAPPSPPLPSGGGSAPGGLPPKAVVTLTSGDEFMLLQQIQFDPGTSKLRPILLQLLDQVADVLKQHPIAVVEVGGHTDSSEPAANRKQLSVARANAVRDHLIKLGVGPKRLRAKGYGAEQPLRSNATPQGRSINRRVQFRVIDTGMKTTYDGWAGVVMDKLAQGNAQGALSAAERFIKFGRSNRALFVGLGLALEATGRPAEAARAFGSLLDVDPSSAELYRSAGVWLERLGGASKEAQALALRAYLRAVALRPDQPSGHRLLAFALARAGKLEEAWNGLEAARERTYSARFPGVRELFGEDLRVLAAAWMRAEPDRKAAIEGRLAKSGLTLPQGPSLAVVLTWETEAGDVDLVVNDRTMEGMDGIGAADKTARLPSGGAFLANVTGYGPEAFVIRRKPAGYPYSLTLRHRGSRQTPFMGKVQVIEHDGRGELRIEDRPFLVNSDGELDLGVVKAQGGSKAEASPK